MFKIGLVSLKNYVAAADATVVKRVKEAGGVIIATTNMMEFGVIIGLLSKIIISIIIF